jgi:hypothetical protein
MDTMQPSKEAHMKTRHRSLLLAVLAIWVRFATQGAAAGNAVVLCDSVCSGSAGCDTSCYATQFDFDQGYPPTTCGDYGASCCGDGLCDPATEGCNVCPADCGSVTTCNSECNHTTSAPVEKYAMRLTSV